MKKALKAIALLTVFAAVLAVAAAAVPALKGESSHKEKEIYNGVTLSRITTPSDSVYNNQTFNIVEFDLKQRDLYLDTFYYNDSATKLARVADDIPQFNSKYPEKTAIAAVNGDMWMVSYSQARIQGKPHTNAAMGGYTDDVVKKEMTVSRSYNVVNGEIYTSGTIPQETPYAGPSWSFGITDDFVPYLGRPTVDVQATDKTNGKTVKIDGINRLPANNAIIMYTDRLMGSLTDFALDTSYELLIEFSEDYTPAHGMNVTGTVKAKYGPEDSANPGKINEKQMVLTSRGNTVDKLKQFNVGDEINITVSVGDLEGNGEAWQRMQSAIGGNIVITNNGVHTGYEVEGGYPTTMVGFTNQGKVLLISMNGRGYGGVGANGARLSQLAKDLDLNSSFILDGGGSMTMVVKDGANYTPVSHAIDSSGTAYRTVNNAFILSYGPERREQGEFKINKPIKLTDPVNLTFETEQHVNTVVGVTNQALASWEDECLKLTANEIATPSAMADPYVSISYQGIENTASANEYKYISYVYRIPETNSQPSYGSEVFCQCEGRGAEGGQSVQSAVKRTGKYEVVTFNPSRLSKWKGTITSLRVDFFYGNMQNGDCIYIHNIILSKTSDEAKKTASAIAAELNGDPPVTEPPVTEPPVTEPPETKPPVTEAPKTEPVTDAPTEPVTDAPTEPVTDAPTEAPTEEPTDAPTEAPTDAPTEPAVPVTEPGVTYGTAATGEQPTAEPQKTESRTDKPAETPSEEPTEKTPVTDKAEDPEGGINPVIAIIVGVAAAAVSATVAILIIKKKKA